MKPIQTKRFIIAIALVAGLTALGWHLLFHGSNPMLLMQADVLKMVSEESQLSFPPDSRVVEVADDGMDSLDRIWLAKVEFGQDGLDAFLKVLSSKPNFNDIRFNGRNESADWWQPDPIKMTRLYDISGSMVYVVASWGKGKKVEVYIEHAVF